MGELRDVFRAKKSPGDTECVELTLDITRFQRTRYSTHDKDDKSRKNMGLALNSSFDTAYPPPWEKWPQDIESVLVFLDNKVHGANMGPTWVLSAPDGSHVGPTNLAIRDPFLWLLEASVAVIVNSLISPILSPALYHVIYTHHVNISFVAGGNKLDPIVIYR